MLVLSVGGGERLEGVAQLILLAARLREASSQPAAKPATSAPTTTTAISNDSECNLPICQARSKAVTRGARGPSPSN